jgi:hypothetical protein
MSISRGRVSFAVLLIGIGLFYLAAAALPSVHEIAYGAKNWPIQIIGLGFLFCIAALLAWKPALFIPGVILTGIGGILFYQNSSGNWASWSYLWTLIPGFVGVGLILFGLLARKLGAIKGGAWNIFSSMVLFGIFGYFFGKIPMIDKLWPAAFILAGVLLLIGAFARKKPVSSE